MTLLPRVVVIHRRSEYDELVARHGTRQQAAFFLKERGRGLDEVVAADTLLATALQIVATAIPTKWRRADVERTDLSRFVFGPEDIIVVVGQDGLVANTAKYLDGQPVIGINPDPARNPGVLVPHPPEAAPALIATATLGMTLQARTMVEATTDDGQSLRALNELYIGHATHQSARYLLGLPDTTPERQSSSGVLAGTGTGATGWLRSAWQERHSAFALPKPTDTTLCWFVREAWPSPATGTQFTEGTLGPGHFMTVTAESDQLVCFGDGIETDMLSLTWGQRLTITTARQQLNLVVA